MRFPSIRLPSSVFAALLLSSVVCCLSSVFAADAVEPASVAVTSLRGEAILAVSQSSFFEGTTLRLTNNIAYAGTTTNSARQGLTDVTLEVRVGSLTTNAPYVGHVASATNGAWWCDIQIPTNLSSVYLQLKLTDATTNIYIYPWKTVNIMQPLD
jgi:opacity protein-like surface antigen